MGAAKDTTKYDPIPRESEEVPPYNETPKPTTQSNPTLPTSSPKDVSSLPAAYTIKFQPLLILRLHSALFSLVSVVLFSIFDRYSSFYAATVILGIIGVYNTFRLISRVISLNYTISFQESGDNSECDPCALMAMLDFIGLFPLLLSLGMGGSEKDENITAACVLGWFVLGFQLLLLILCSQPDTWSMQLHLRRVTSTKAATREDDIQLETV